MAIWAGAETAVPSRAATQIRRYRFMTDPSAQQPRQSLQLFLAVFLARSAASGRATPCHGQETVSHAWTRVLEGDHHGPAVPNATLATSARMQKGNAAAL